MKKMHYSSALAGKHQVGARSTLRRFGRLSGLLALTLALGILPQAAFANPFCGDGIIQAGEGCDDGNHLDGDGCEHNCRLPHCGNGELDRGEECDDGNRTKRDGCQNTCLLPYCGDGIKDVEQGEQCDHGVKNSDAASNECRTDCTKPRCGDGVVDTLFKEVCDDGNNLGGDGCSPNCRQEGCQPKYWSEPKHFFQWDKFEPEQRFNAVFGVERAGDPTLLEALQARGLDAELVLGRHAVAALLNATSDGIGFGFTKENVISMVQEAYRTGEFQVIKNILAKENLRDCPL